MKKKVGVVLSGCGVYDGSEIHEAVITLLALDRAGVEAVCMAPDVDQLHVINHLTGKEAGNEKRNVLVEAARIARGNIKDMATVKADDIDAILVRKESIALISRTRIACASSMAINDPVHGNRCLYQPEISSGYSSRVESSGFWWSLST